MDFWSNYTPQSPFVLQKDFKVVLVVVAPIFVLNDVTPFMTSFWIPHINNIKHVYTLFQCFSFGLYYCYNFGLKPHATV